MTDNREHAIPGADLLHPLPLACIALLIVNDHWLKGAAPGWLTGKLSDVAGLGFFPLLLLALFEFSRIRHPLATHRRALFAATAATAIAFTLLQVWPPAAEIYEVGLGVLRWPVDALRAAASGQLPAAPCRVAVTPDPSDLWALPALIIPFAATRSRRQVPGFLQGRAPAG